MLKILDNIQKALFSQNLHNKIIMKDLDYYKLEAGLTLLYGVLYNFATKTFYFLNI